MDKYLEATNSLLGLIQAIMTEEEMKRSQEAGTELWEEIKRITEKYKLNVREMLNATLACHYTIVEAANEEINKERDASNDE